MRWARRPEVTRAISVSVAVATMASPFAHRADRKSISRCDHFIRDSLILLRGIDTTIA